uniref:Uncharacterized protein n=1 Tax=Oryza brachyantha TaxID=4533 RepID=J3MGH9_ORYBR
MGLELELSSELAALRPVRVTATRPEGDACAAGSGDARVQEESGPATVRQGGDGGDGGEKDDGTPAESAGCATPTSAASAPRKPRPGKRMKRCCCGRPRRSFFPVPHDLAAVFVARAPPATSPPCPPAKKIRVHAVG